MTKRGKIIATVVFVLLICTCIGIHLHETNTKEVTSVSLTDSSVKNESVSGKLDTSALDNFLMIEKPKTDEPVAEGILEPDIPLISDTNSVSESTPEPNCITILATDNSAEESTLSVKGPYYLTSVDSAEDILRNEDYVESVVWYRPVDTEEIKITVRSNTDELQYITYETGIPYEVLDDIVNILRNNPKPTDDSEITTEVKRDYVFTSAESARYLIINEAKYGLKMVIWHGIPDTQEISIAVEKENGVAESYKTGVPRDEWDRIEEVLLQLDLDNK